MKTPFLAVCSLVFSMTAFAAEGTTQVRWLGHAAFQITTPQGHVLLIDPWVSNPLNPDGKNGKDPLAAIPKADYILITHAHGDHVGEAVPIGKKTGAKLVTNFELGSNLVTLAGYPKAQAGMDTLFNIGGQLHLADGEVVVTMVPAVHSSGLQKPGSDEIVYGGNPAGFVVAIKNGPTIYHTGDTAYFDDMRHFADYHVDLALMNVGGHFDAEPPAVAQAAKVIQPKLVVPMHFKTFPILTQDTGPFFKLLDGFHIAHREMQPGETLVFEGRKLKK